jgi:hypothetical protein
MSAAEIIQTEAGMQILTKIHRVSP